MLEDFDQIDMIEQEVFTHPFPKSVFINDYSNNSFSRYIKLTMNNEIIGYCAAWFIFEDCQIISIGIKQAYQRQGFGILLMKEVMKQAKDEGCESITLEVRFSNEKAINMYVQLGFYKISVRKGYYEDGENAYLMKCDL